MGPASRRVSRARAVVEVREHLDGSLSVWHQGQRIMTTSAPEDAPRLRLGAVAASSDPSLAHSRQGGADMFPEQ